MGANGDLICFQQRESTQALAKGRIYYDCTELVVPIHDTIHAGQRRSQRGVTREDMESALNAPDHVEKQNSRGPHGGVHRIYVKKLASGKTLCVVAEVKKDDIWVATTYFR